MKYGGAGGLFLAIHGALFYPVLDLGQRTGSAPTQMLQRCVRALLSARQQGRCALSQGLETRPSARRMSSLLTSADSKASLIQQRQQRISACKPSPCRFAQLYFSPTLWMRRVTSCSIALAMTGGAAAAPIHRPTRDGERGSRRRGEEGWSSSGQRAHCCRLTITS